MRGFNCICLWLKNFLISARKGVLHEILELQGFCIQDDIRLLHLLRVFIAHNRTFSQTSYSRVTRKVICEVLTPIGTK